MTDRRRERLINLTEDQFHEVLLELLPKMGAKNVRHTHGPTEHGKDIVFYKEDEFGRTYCAVVAKVGNISGAMKGRNNLNSILSIVENQIKEAYRVPFEDATSDSSPRIEIREVIVWTTGKISNTAQKTIIEGLRSEYRNVRFRTGDQTLTLIETHLPKFFDVENAFVSRYNDCAIAKYQRLEDEFNIGELSGSKALSNVFVEPKLQVVSRAKGKELRQDELNSTLPFKRFVSMKRNSAVVGEMGTGKSTLLRQFLISCIVTNQQKYQMFPIPILINFRNLDLSRANPLNHVEECIIQSALLQEIKSVTGTEYPGDIQDDLRNGRITILMDGLDELESTSAFTAMDVTRCFASRYKGCRVVVASRIALLTRKNLFGTFKIYRLGEFTYKEINQLVSNWFGRNSTDCKRLMKMITRPIAIYSIPNTPLALSLIVALYEGGTQDIPANLTELIDRYIQRALGRWNKSGLHSSSIKWSYKEQVLQSLSWYLLSQGRSVFRGSEFLAIAESFKSERALPFEPESLVREILHRSSLLVRTDDGRIVFRHQSFMDYFCGKEINDLEDSNQLVARKFAQVNWSAPIFFACGMNPKRDSYLISILQKTPSESEDMLSRAINLGLVAQASYMVREETKRRIVISTLLAFVESWNSLALEIMAGDEGQSSTEYLPQAVLVFLYSNLVRSSLNTSTLRFALDDVVNSLIDKSCIISEMNDDVRKRIELLAFSVAVSCAGAGSIGGFASLMSSPLISDPVYALMGRIEIGVLRAMEVLSDSDREVLGRLNRRLNRKVSNNRKYLQDTVESKPVLLPESSSETWKSDLGLHQPT